MYDTENNNREYEKKNVILAKLLPTNSKERDVDFVLNGRRDLLVSLPGDSRNFVRR